VTQKKKRTRRDNESRYVSDALKLFNVARERIAHTWMESAGPSRFSLSSVAANRQSRVRVTRDGSSRPEFARSAESLPVSSLLPPPPSFLLSL